MNCLCALNCRIQQSWLGEHEYLKEIYWYGEAKMSYWAGDERERADAYNLEHQPAYRRMKNR